MDIMDLIGKTIVSIDEMDEYYMLTLDDGTQIEVAEIYEGD